MEKLRAHHVTHVTEAPPRQAPTAAVTREGPLPFSLRHRSDAHVTTSFTCRRYPAPEVTGLRLRQAAPLARSCAISHATLLQFGTWTVMQSGASLATPSCSSADHC